MPIVVNTNTKESERDRWRTPPALFQLLNDGFEFHLDAAADHENALCERYYTREYDALSRPWFVPDEGIWRVFCNPPFSRAAEFLAKGNEESEKGALVVFLVRADALETDWWTQNILDDRREPYMAAQKHFVGILKPRVPYLLPDGETSDSPPFATAVVTMTPPGYELGQWPQMYWWWWKEEAIAKGYM